MGHLSSQSVYDRMTASRDITGCPLSDLMADEYYNLEKNEIGALFYVLANPEQQHVGLDSQGAILVSSAGLLSSQPSQ